MYWKATRQITQRLITFVRGSSKRGGRLKELCEIAGAEHKKIGIMYEIRWLAKETVIKAIFFSLLGILDFLKEESNNGNSEATWLYERVANVYYLSYLCMILDILIHIGILSRYFQANWIFCGNITQRINLTMTNIRSILSGNPSTASVYSNSLINQINTGIFNRHSESLDDKQQQWMKNRKKEALPLIEKEYAERMA